MSTCASSIESLDAIYQNLNEKEHNIFRTLIESDEWQFDLECVIDDINDGDESELKEALSTELYEKIKSMLAGNYTHEQKTEETENENEHNQSKLINCSDGNYNPPKNDEITELKQRLQQTMSNKAAADCIITTIEDEEYIMETINDEIEDPDNSDIKNQLKKNNFETYWVEFCNIVTNKISSQNNTQILIKFEKDSTQKPILHPKQIQNKSAEDPKLLNLKAQISSKLRSDVAQTIIDKIEEEQYDFDALKDDIADDENSEFLSEFENMELESMFAEYCEIIRNIDNMDTEQLATHSIIKVSGIGNYQDIKETARDHKALFEKHKFMQQRLNEMHPGDTNNNNNSDNNFQDEILINLRCAFGTNAPLQMYELELRQLSRAISHKDLSQSQSHSEWIEKIEFKTIECNFFAKKFISYKLMNDTEQRWDTWSKGLRLYGAFRFFGPDKIKGICLQNRKLDQRFSEAGNMNDSKDNDDDDDDDDDSSDDECDDIYDQRLNEQPTNSQQNGDDFMYYPVLRVQIYGIAFCVALIKHLLNPNYPSNANYTVALHMKLPILKDNPDSISNQQCTEETIDDIVRKFEDSLKQSRSYYGLEKSLKAYKIAVWNADFNNNNNHKIEQPKFVGLSPNEVGFEMKDDEYDKYFKDWNVFQPLRVKRYLKLNRSENLSEIAWSIHKFGKTIKIYLHYKEAVMRFDLKDFGTWFRFLWHPNHIYHQKEINTSNWKNSAGKYLEKVLIDNKDLNHLALKGHKVPLSRSSDVIWQSINNWREIDQEFYDKDALLTQEIKEKIPNLQSLLDVNDN